MRLIDADELMVEIMDSDLDHLQRDDWREVIQIVQDAPTIQTQWIPCSERLPRESDDYLCSYGTLTGHFVGIDIYEAEKKEFGFYSDDEQGNEVWHPVKNVVAWMPLPEPWKEDRMNHDATHCIAADSRCPKECYRFQLTEEYEEYLRMGMRLPVSWSDFEGTDECMKEEQE